MNPARIKQLLQEGKLRIRSVDRKRITSLIDSAKNNANAVKKIPITHENATIVFREIYESIRQIGDARWLSLGYEPSASHEVSMEILREMNIKHSIKLHKLDRFRRTRNNANYRGYKVSIEEAKEIVDFWNECAEELIKKIL
jgi:hypothetical protein